MKAWGREAAVVAQQGMLIARRALRPRPLGVPTERGVVVFVHGFFAAGPVFDPLRERVENELGIATNDMTYGPLREFESIAASLGEHIASRIPDGVPVDIVGHSLGGLVARWYLQVLGGQVRSLVTLATPHGGMRKARFMPGSLSAVLRPGSRVLERLGQSAGDVPHLVIVGGRDRLVAPQSASAVDNARVVQFDDLGHNELLYDHRVQQSVVDALAGSI